MIEDSELLCQFAVEGSQDAFAELVRRRINLVYGIALRQARGDAEMAKDVVQMVFVTLARKASSLHQHEVIAGWLCRCAELAARDRMRAERRRTNREQKAHAMNQPIDDRQASEWNALRPELDRVLSNLNEVDRNAIVLRFFDQQSFGEIGARLKLTENAARMRVERGLERMHALLARQGITSTAAAIGSALASGSSMAAPTGLAATVSTAALTGAGMTTGLTIPLFSIMSTSKTIAAIAGAVALGSFTYSVYLSRATGSSERAAVQARTERDVLRQQLTQETNSTLKLRAEIDALKAQVAASTPTQSAPAVTVGQAIEGLNGPPKLLLRNVVARNLYVEGHRAALRRRYEQFFRSEGLNQAQQEQVVRKFSEILENSMDVQELLASNELSKNPEAATKARNMINEARQQNARDMLAILGPERYERFGDYQHRSNADPVIEQMASRLYYTESPLQVEQATALARILVNTSQANLSVGPKSVWTVAGEAVPQSVVADYNRVTRMKDEEIRPVITDAVITQAASTLAPAQVTALKQIQVEQLIQIKLAPVRLNKAPSE